MVNEEAEHSSIRPPGTPFSTTLPNLEDIPARDSVIPPHYKHHLALWDIASRSPPERRVLLDRERAYFLSWVMKEPSQYPDDIAPMDPEEEHTYASHFMENPKDKEFEAICKFAFGYWCRRILVNSHEEWHSKKRIALTQTGVLPAGLEFPRAISGLDLAAVPEIGPFPSSPDSIIIDGGTLIDSSGNVMTTILNTSMTIAHNVRVGRTIRDILTIDPDILPPVADIMDANLRTYSNTDSPERLTQPDTDKILAALSLALLFILEKAYQCHSPTSEFPEIPESIKDIAAEATLVLSKITYRNFCSLSTRLSDVAIAIIDPPTYQTIWQQTLQNLFCSKENPVITGQTYHETSNVRIPNLELLMRTPRPIVEKAIQRTFTPELAMAIPLDIMGFILPKKIRTFGQLKGYLREIFAGKVTVEPHQMEIATQICAVQINRDHNRIEIVCEESPFNPGLEEEPGLGYITTKGGQIRILSTRRDGDKIVHIGILNPSGKDPYAAALEHIHPGQYAIIEKDNRPLVKPYACVRVKGIARSLNKSPKTNDGMTRQPAKSVYARLISISKGRRGDPALDGHDVLGVRFIAVDQLWPKYLHRIRKMLERLGVMVTITADASGRSFNEDDEWPAYHLNGMGTGKSRIRIPTSTPGFTCSLPLHAYTEVQILGPRVFFAAQLLREIKAGITTGHFLATINRAETALKPIQMALAIEGSRPPTALDLSCFYSRYTSTQQDPAYILSHIFFREDEPKIPYPPREILPTGSNSAIRLNASRRIVDDNFIDTEIIPGIMLYHHTTLQTIRELLNNLHNKEPQSILKRILTKYGLETNEIIEINEQKDNIILQRVLKELNARGKKCMALDLQQRRNRKERLSTLLLDIVFTRAIPPGDIVRLLRA